MTNKCVCAHHAQALLNCLAAKEYDKCAHLAAAVRACAVKHVRWGSRALSVGADEGAADTRVSMATQPPSAARGGLQTAARG